ncbi:hypothetical protein LZ32DRAFT_612055 [Colletotrichum eremochloae]|nr:hypothetical protein LZ32DRAFT_612055 [Colletotrichum eremochloae]
MKTSIIQALIVTLAARVQVTKACAEYLKCRCTMADGSINNNFTEQACAKVLSNTRGAAGDGATAFQPVTDGNNTAWCNYGHGPVLKAFFYLDNCGFREVCAAVGATGSDSWCEGKH